MSDDLSQELRAFEGSEALANGVFAVCIRGADRIEAQAARIAELEAALQDISKHIWRGDWDKLKPETRAALGDKK